MYVHVSNTEKKRRLIQAVVAAFQALSPPMLKEMADSLESMYKNEYNPRTGKLKAESDGRLEHGGYIKVRVPQELFFAIRKFWPEFGNDDKDLKLLAEEFPKLGFHRNVQGKNSPSNSMRVARNYT